MLDSIGRRHAALCAGLVLAIAAGPTVASEEGALKYRQSVMRAVVGHTGAIAQIVMGKVSHQEHLAGHAEALADLAGLVPAAFEEQISEGKTRAKAAIWEDWKGFEGRAEDFRKATAKLAEVARGGGDLKGAFKATTEACKGCHKKFRKKKP